MHTALHAFFCFLGAALTVNVIPHFVSGVSGRAFQTPFAKPPGIGLSSARTNVAWAAINAVLGWLLLVPAAHADPALWTDALALGAGGLAMALFCAHHFGPLHGGDRP